MTIAVENIAVTVIITKMSTAATATFVEVIKVFDSITAYVINERITQLIFIETYIGIIKVTCNFR